MTEATLFSNQNEQADMPFGPAHRARTDQDITSLLVRVGLKSDGLNWVLSKPPFFETFDVRRFWIGQPINHKLILSRRDNYVLLYIPDNICR